MRWSQRGRGEGDGATDAMEPSSVPSSVCTSSGLRFIAYCFTLLLMFRPRPRQLTDLILSTRSPSRPRPLLPPVYPDPPELYDIVLKRTMAKRRTL